jgi:hypothetical protein
MGCQNFLIEDVEYKFIDLFGFYIFTFLCVFNNENLFIYKENIIISV